MDYRKAYETAKRDLAELIVNEEKLQRKKVALRKTIETLATLCESENIEIDPSPEADYLLKNSSVADEIRGILKAAYPAFMRPNAVKGEMEKLGHDLKRFDNPQATIHMVLKRMAESGEVREREMPEDGKKAYRYANPLLELGQQFAAGEILRKYAESLTGSESKPFQGQVTGKVRLKR